MSDTFTSPLMLKLMAGLGGLIGGVSFMIFYKPCNVWDASVRSGLSVISAIVFAPIVLEWINLSSTSDNVLAVSVGIGFSSWSILSLIARFLMNIQDEKVNFKLPAILERKD
jgi:hypothetical protein